MLSGYASVYPIYLIAPLLSSFNYDSLWPYITREAVSAQPETPEAETLPL